MFFRRDVKPVWCFSSTSSWPTSSGCWLRVCTSTPCSSYSSLRTATLSSTCLSAGVGEHTVGCTFTPNQPKEGCSLTAQGLLPTRAPRSSPKGATSGPAVGSLSSPSATVSCGGATDQPAKPSPSHLCQRPLGVTNYYTVWTPYFLALMFI